MIVMSAHSAKSKGTMANTGFCAGSLKYYTLPGWRLEIEREFSGTNVDEVIKVSLVNGVVKRGDTELVSFQVYKQVQRLTFSYCFQWGSNCGSFEITFSASGLAR